eukprot:3833554-Pyramimonas_sp.AAC.2
MSVWARNLERTSTCKTQGFVGDSSVIAAHDNPRNVTHGLSIAWRACNRVAKLSGCVLSATKVKALANTNAGD